MKATDLNLQPPAEGHVIRSLQADGLHIDEDIYATSVALNLESLISDFPAHTLAELSMECLEPVLAWQPDVIVVGTWEASPMPQVELLGRCQALGVGIEFMTLGAACRTYNVLTAEARPVAAVLLQQSNRKDQSQAPKA